MSGVDCDVVLIYLFACWGILLGGVKGGGGSAGGGGGNVRCGNLVRSEGGGGET